MSQALPENNKTFDDIMTITSSCIFCSFRIENSRKSELLCFSSNLIEIWYGGNFEMRITKRRLKLKLENVFSQKNAIFYRF